MFHVWIWSSRLTLKKSKKGVDFTSSPYFSGSFLKKNMWVRAASMISGSFRDIITRSSRSWRLSRPRQNALSVLFSHATLVAWTDNTSSVTLQNMQKDHIYFTYHDIYSSKSWNGTGIFSNSQLGTIFIT